MSHRFLILTASLLVCGCQLDEMVQEPSPRNRPPKAWLDGPTVASEGMPVTLDARSSSDPDGDTLIYAWTFGDGSTGVGPAAVHHFGDDCVCSITLIVTDAHGAADTAIKSIAVQNAAPRIDGLSPSPAVAPARTPVGVNVRIYDVGRADTHSIVIDWGDGQSSALTGSTTTHEYLHGGAYSVTVTVTDDDGAVTSRTAANAFLIYDPTGTESGYEAIDLGTLGGRSARALALNDAGQVVGYSETADGRTHAFLWQDGVMRDIGGSYNWSSAHVVTNSGRIGGVAMDHETRVFVWENGVVTELGSIGPSGGAAGLAAITNSEVVAWRGNWTAHQSAIWRNGMQQDLGSVGTAFHDARAAAMNNQRQITGFGLFAYPPEGVIYRAFVWEDGTMRTLSTLPSPPCPSRPTLACSSAQATDINNDGIVVGMSRDVPNNWRAVRWVNGTIEDLGPGGARAINERGDIIINRFGQAAFWRQGATQTLASFGSGYTYVADLNDEGVTTGMSMDSERKPLAFVWRPGQINLTALGMPHAGVDGALPVAINSFGDVIGYAWPAADGVNPQGPTRAVLWRRIR